MVARMNSFIRHTLSLGLAFTLASAELGLVAAAYSEPTTMPRVHVSDPAPCADLSLQR